MQIHISSTAELELSKLSQLTQNRIVNKIELYAQQPDPLKFAKYIAQRKSYRFRVGDYRIFFEPKDSVIHVTEIARRDKAYD
ncbi:MAG: type II toxin-antitoxin system RelE/ParE family toxin [Patescibacteria group bacterium]